MAGNQTTDIGQLTKILTIAVIITIILVAAVGVLFVFKMISSDAGSSESPDTTSSPDASSTVQPTYTEQTPESTYDYNTESASKTTIQIPEDKSADDSAKMIGSFVPDDPAFSSPEFNTTIADYTISTEYYQLLYKKEQDLQYDSFSIVVTVGKGPLVVYYGVSDYSENENGDDDYGGENPNYSYVDINVTNYKTGEVVATGGFGRKYPSTEEQYLKIPSTGEFKIDVYGTDLDLDLEIFSGTVPENPSAIMIESNMKDKYLYLAEKASKVKTT